MRLTKHLRECFVRAVFNDVPEIAFPTYAQVQAALYENFDPKIKAVFDDVELRKSLKTNYFCAGMSCEYGYIIQAGQDYETLQIVVDAYAAANARNAAMKKLRAAADGCNNLKQLQDTLPELIKYMVSEEKPTPVNLPVITGTVDALKALGWKA